MAKPDQTYKSNSKENSKGGFNSSSSKQSSTTYGMNSGSLHFGTKYQGNSSKEPVLIHFDAKITKALDLKNNKKT